MNNSRDGAIEPNPIVAIWRSRWLVLLTALIVTGLGIAYAYFTPATYSSSVSVVLRNPANTAFLTTGPAVRDDRYVADQVDVIQSAAVAEEAADLLASSSPPINLSVQTVVAATSVFSNRDTNVVTIAFSADEPAVAEAGARAISTAYEELVRAEATDKLIEELGQIDSALATVDEETVALQAAIERSRLESGASDEIDQQFNDALEEFQSLTRMPRNEIDRQAAFEDLTRRLQVLSLLQQNASAQPGLAALLRQLEDAFQLRRELATRRIETELSGQLAASGTALVTPATTALSQARPVFSTGIAAAIMGLLIGAALGYYRAVRRPTFTERSQPELVLGTPLVADVPSFRAERISSPIPARDSPATVSAESFLFISTAIDLLGDYVERSGSSNRAAALAPMSGDGHQGQRIVAIVSAMMEEGRTTIATNTAIAAARGGRRVLLVDCEFGEDRIAEILFSDSEQPRRGLSDIVEESIQNGTNWSVVTEAAEDLDFIGRGSKNVDGATLFQSREISSFFAWSRTRYDLVLLDVPPITQASWAGAIVRHADSALAVVRHGSMVVAASELRERLEFLGVPLMGYVYNMAPLRSEMWWRLQRDTRKRELPEEASA
jgi:Mrp family chromosome partitioning ATPase/capsular polysaccharide biosynthesis protein